MKDSNCYLDDPVHAIACDTIMIHFALSHIKKYLGFAATFLIWVLNAYLVVGGSFLLLESRIGGVFEIKMRKVLT